jgi:predicted porin
LDSNYLKWSFRLGPQLNRINTDLGTTTPTLTLGGLVEIEYRFSKTVGLVSGAQFTPISYSYIEADTLAKDRLKYISYPLMLRLQPTYRLSFGLGIIYQAFLNGQKELGEEEAKLTTPYAKGIFKNSIGMIGQLSYHLNARFNVFANYRWVKRTSPPTQTQTNNTIGFQLGVSYLFLKSKLRP